MTEEGKGLKPTRIDRKRVPVVLFAEGGGGRPGDTDAGAGAGLELGTFRAMAALSGRVPMVAVVSGRCFAGNAALAGACDVLIATPDANIGMGGPAMVEGGGLGNFRPEDIGPIDVQRRNGVVHLVADDDAHAVALAKQYLGYFQGASGEWTAPDPRLSRHVVPENRLRSYDVRGAIDAIADVDSVLELRRDYGRGVVTALVRVEGVPYGVLANSSEHLGGAIDAEASDKASDFLELLEAHRIPLVTLCDTPGLSALHFETVDHSLPLNDPKNLYPSNIRIAVVKKNVSSLKKLVADRSRRRRSLRGSDEHPSPGLRHRCRT